MGIKRKYIVVKGIVQGVGFRPFVFNLAIDNNLNGWVINSSMGVLIDIEGLEYDVEKFIGILTNTPPPLSKIKEIIIEDKPCKNYTDFEIKFTEDEGKALTLISPDFATCKECHNDIYDKNNRRYRYPFTNCTNCGPRFSIIKKLPYDREVTTMQDFIMCKECKDEYTNPLNRRFHAQPNGCPNCGPNVKLVNCNNEEIICKDAILESINQIKLGKIIGVKGIGGYNLVCDGTNSKAVSELRKRKRRPTKPLAVMMRDLEVVKKYCYVSKNEEVILDSNKKPIVLLKKKENYDLTDEIAKSNKRLGVMLPYSPLHSLLFDEDIEVLIMTSGNISGQPMIFENHEAIEELRGIVDYFLIHNRDIYIPIDDSVTRIIDEEEQLIRPARGYSPMTLEVKTNENIVALGSFLKNTFTVCNGENAFISQYIGDLTSAKNYDHLEKNLNHYIELYKISYDLVSYDLHPDFYFKELLKNKKLKEVLVQHHHAHVVSCMAENSVKDKVIGVAFDGTGYGDDNKIWGGEFLICDYKDYQRVAHVDYFPLPTGEGAIKEPWKIATSLVHRYCNEEIELLKEKLQGKNIDLIIKIIESNVNSPETSSIGRLFDGVAAILGFDGIVTYEGEAAIYLENLCCDVEGEGYLYVIEEVNDKLLFKPNLIIKEIIRDLVEDVQYSVIARKFHNTICKATVDICDRLRKKYNINKVALSGGVFQNEILLTTITRDLRKNKFEVYRNKLIPCNDSGISIGQLYIAANNGRN